MLMGISYPVVFLFPLCPKFELFELLEIFY